MTKITRLGLSRKFERDPRGYGNIKRKEVINFSRQKVKLDCGMKEFEIFVSPGQAINKVKMCKRLLSNKY